MLTLVIQRIRKITGTEFIDLVFKSHKKLLHSLPLLIVMITHLYVSKHPFSTHGLHYYSLTPLRTLKNALVEYFKSSRDDNLSIKNCGLERMT